MKQKIETKSMKQLASILVRIAMHTLNTHHDSCISGHTNSRTSFAGSALAGFPPPPPPALPEPFPLDEDPAALFPAAAFDSAFFPPAKLGMASSRTQPRSGRSSLVRTISLYMNWSRSGAVGRTSKGGGGASDEESWSSGVVGVVAAGVGFAVGLVVVGGTFSLRMEMATGPRMSSTPNQFWWSETEAKINLFEKKSVLKQAR